MPISRDDLERYLDDLLEPDAFSDYGPNGLQIEGGDHVATLATAATASLHSCRAAAEADADALLVHHGVLWGGGMRITGLLRPRVATLLAAECSLFAYHLPLDAHLAYGNNAVAIQLLGAVPGPPFALHRGREIGLSASFAEPVDPGELAERCRAAFGHPVLHCPGRRTAIGRFGVVTGGGQRFLAEAAHHGLDALITGEASEQTWHEAAELDCHCFACGHHATECHAVHRLGAALAERFGLAHVRIAEENPV